MKAIDFHPDARAELDEAMAYFESQRAGYGKRLREAVNQALGRTRSHPDWFAQYGKGNARECILTKFPYAIYFVELTNRIWIAAVAHGSRRPGYWLKRTPKDARK
jgi:toxin ParE1/3/4